MPTCGPYPPRGGTVIVLVGEYLAPMATATTGPPPVGHGDGLAVPIDMHRLVASARFDVGARTAQARASVDFTVAGPSGRPVFDLRQEVAGAVLDGRALGPEGLAHADMGAGYDARMRVLDAVLDEGSRHHLALEYPLGTPSATGARPLGWAPGGDGVAWDLWMSDLEPGRYLEMWFPANLCHDRLAVELDVEVVGTDRPHLLLANGEVDATVPGYRWTVRYPATYTSLSPMLVLAPADEVEVAQATVLAGGQELALEMALLEGSGADLEAVTADCGAWLAGFGQRYGPWAHGGRFLAAIWGPPRGMEYDGATTASVEALEHEVFHSWFGRGVKPASAADGWVDEAMATWATASSRSGAARWACQELGLDEPPSLLCPPHPWSRHTPREAYAQGARLLAGVAHMAGGPAPLRSALAAWHKRYAGGPASTEDLARHLSQWCGRDLSPWWDRYVHGASPPGP
jgi:hypothetical protein